MCCPSAKGVPGRRGLRLAPIALPTNAFPKSLRFIFNFSLVGLQTLAEGKEQFTRTAGMLLFNQMIDIQSID
jgi:hypothetical protein